MPLLYGEGGENAFRRLQEEIIKKTTDETILAWGIDGVDRERIPKGSCLAKTPFQGSSDIQRDRHSASGFWAPFVVTHKGLQIETKVISMNGPRPFASHHRTDGHQLSVLTLNCSKKGSHQPLALLVYQLRGESRHPALWHRVALLDGLRDFSIDDL
jgi:hypothetical protein